MSPLLCSKQPQGLRVTGLPGWGFGESGIFPHLHRLPGKRPEGGDHGGEGIQLGGTAAIKAQQHLVGSGLPIQWLVSLVAAAATALTIAGGQLQLINPAIGDARQALEPRDAHPGSQLHVAQPKSLPPPPPWIALIHSSGAPVGSWW